VWRTHHNETVNNFDSDGGVKEGAMVAHVKEKSTKGKKAGNGESNDEVEENKSSHQQSDADAPLWRKSAARDFLYNALLEGIIPQNPTQMKPREVYDTFCKMRPEFKHFQDYKALDFASRLRSARERVNKKTSRADTDLQAFEHDRLIFPAPTHDMHGEEMWQGSKAQELLRKDIKDGIADKLKPKVLYEKREEYYEKYSLDRFRDRIYQERKAMKRAAYVSDKRQQQEEKANKKK